MDDDRGSTTPRQGQAALAGLLCGVLGGLLPFLDGGRSTEGFGCFVAAAGIIGLVAFSAWRRPSLVEFAAGGCVLLAWAWLPWSPCPYAGFRATLYVTAAAILFLSLPVVLADHRGRALLVAGLLAGILSSLRHVYPQLHTEGGVPDHWVDPEFAGILPFRVSGPMQNPNTFAAYMALSLPLLAGAVLCSRRGVAVVLSLAAAAATAGLILTFSRAAWLGATVGLAVVIGYAASTYPARLIRLITIPVAVLICALLYGPAMVVRGTTAPSMEQGTLQHRLFMWKAGVNMWRGGPLFGRGPGAYEVLYSAYRPRQPVRNYALLSEPGSAHSDYIQLLSEGGAFAGLLLALGLYGLSRDARRAACIRRHGAVLAAAVGIALCAAAGGLFQSNLKTPLCLLLLLVGLALLRPASSVPQTPERRSPPAWSIAWLSLCLLIPVGGPLLTSSELALNRATSEGLNNRFADARAILNTANPVARWDARFHCLHGDMASSEHLRSGDTRALLAAEGFYRQAISLDPYGAVLRAKLADVLERRGRLEDALDAYLQACELDYYCATYHLEAGRLALDLNRRELGEEHLRISLELFPPWIDLTRRRQGADALYVQILQAAEKDARGMLGDE